MTDRQDASAAASSPSQRLDERYGNTRTSRVRLKVTLWALAAFITVVFVAWVVWAGLLVPGAQLEAKDIAHTIVDEQTVEITYQITVDHDTTTMCALQAQDEQHSIVGWKIVTIPASETRTTQYTDTVRTVDEATTGLIYRCWLP